jgi:hypothetical protein
MSLSPLSIDSINSFLDYYKRKNIRTVEKCLDDNCLKVKFSKSPSFLKNIAKITKILEREKISKCKINYIMKSMACFSLPAGTKGSIRGLTFNNIVSAMIKKVIKKHPHIKLNIEQKHRDYHEKADWILTNSNTKRNIIGYNQLDLWNGGAQMNRASKYILDDTMHRDATKKKIKIVSVIARMPSKAFKTTSSKLYKIFDIGIRKQRLFFLEGLQMFIESWIK